MLRTVFLIRAEIAGYPVFGFGLLLALWAVASVVTLAWLARRQGFNADTWGYVPILLLMGTIIAWLLPAICERTPEGVLLGLPIRGYGLMMLLAVVAGTLLAVWRAKRAGLDPDLIFTLIFWMLVPGIIGARAFYVIEYWDDDYVKLYTNPDGSFAALLGGILNITGGGLVVYGSFFGGVIGILLFVRKYRVSLLAAVRFDGPVHAAGPGHWANRLLVERLLLRGGVRRSVGDPVSRRHAAQFHRALRRQARSRPFAETATRGSGAY